MPERNLFSPNSGEPRSQFAVRKRYQFVCDICHTHSLITHENCPWNRRGGAPSGAAGFIIIGGMGASAPISDVNYRIA